MSIRKHIPDTITSMNLLCGVMGVIFTLKGRPDTGFLLMIGGAVCDFFDGLAARLLKASSGIGKELDSLADMVTFGVLPSLMLFGAGGADNVILKHIPLLLAVFSALRLAKFNIDERQHGSFLGLPTPASAMICGALCCYVFMEPASAPARWCAAPWVLPLLAVVLSVLLISELPMFAMKFGKGIEGTDRRTRVKRIAFLAIAVIGTVVTIALAQHWSLAVLLAFLGYVLVNLF